MQSPIVALVICSIDPMLTIVKSFVKLLKALALSAKELTILLQYSITSEAHTSGSAVIVR